MEVSETLTSKPGERALIRRWYHWYDVNASKQERRLLRKLDFCILLYTCLTFFVKYLDQTNVTNAWLTGMQTDLKFKGNELNWFTTYFSVGVIIGAPISTCMLTVIQPRFWLPFCTMGWSFFVLFMYKAENAATLYALRFCCGLFEAGAYPGCLYVIGSWYTKSEISRRTGIFLFASVFGGMCSGYIQAGLHKNMDGVAGLASWRWLFIFDFLLGIPVAIFGFFVCPDEPKGKKIWWMTEEEKALSIHRMKRDGRDAVGVWTWDVVRQILRSWQFYGFVIGWGFVELTCGNNLQRAVAADSLNNRAIPFVVLCVFMLFSYIVFLVGTNNIGLRMAAYFIGGAYGGLSPLLGGWINCSCGGNKQLRSFITAMMISVGYAIEAPAQQVVFPVSQAPDFRPTNGYAYGVGMVVATAVWCGAVIPLMSRFWFFKDKQACLSCECEEPIPESTTYRANNKTGEASD
ncbi:Major facilitator superfamily domain, general substrate transporter [Cordyceps fumosorosea ARSEF 2679]|uniref:Major facilitator superfamily domain, general substrate transporter n=1 Tax=Cordyceps fumosorosea (strain ARSEF 2679) TaxID=1081104 RepID=A0A162IFH1_CORFA|nr:Major facilitator superfamily domain, general substrate transporter [Cordyceps fumosorosea ARSEF 2679]OAA56405.1 Major facilitator superfamily domain, general substrate transporter [Cordyceps fumosorosea ARSEF 2679]